MGFLFIIIKTLFFWIIMLIFLLFFGILNEGYLGKQKGGVKLEWLLIWNCNKEKYIYNQNKVVSMIN